MPRKEVDLSEAVTELLEAAAPDLKQLARDAKVGYATVRGWAKEGRQPRDATLDRILEEVERRHDRIDRLLKQIRAGQRRRSG